MSAVTVIGVVTYGAAFAIAWALLNAHAGEMRGGSAALAMLTTTAEVPNQRGVITEPPLRATE